MPVYLSFALVAARRAECIPAPLGGQDAVLLFCTLTVAKGKGGAVSYLLKQSLEFHDATYGWSSLRRSCAEKKQKQNKVVRASVRDIVGQLLKRRRRT